MTGPYSSASAWAGGPGLIYDRLADALVAHAPHDLDGRSLLDVGAGTGAVSRAATTRGAVVIAVDASPDMLHEGRARRPPATVADAGRLPFGTGSFDVAAAGFVLSHVLDPVRVLHEMARVASHGGVVLTSSFAADNRHPAKQAVDAALEQRGWRAPEWYVELKRTTEPRVADVDAVATLASEAGLEQIDIVAAAVDTRVGDPAVLAAWRLGMAHVAPFVDALDTDARAELERAAVDAIGPTPEPLRPSVLFLVARTR